MRGLVRGHGGRTAFGGSGGSPRRGAAPSLPRGLGHPSAFGSLAAATPDIPDFRCEGLSKDSGHGGLRNDFFFFSEPFSKI